MSVLFRSSRNNANAMIVEFILSVIGAENAFPELSGAVLVCSVPPSGNR